MKHFNFKVNGTQYNVEIISIEDTIAIVNVNGAPYEVEVEQLLKTTKTPTLIRPLAVPSTDSTPSIARTASPSSPKGVGIIKSPLPGKILDLLVKEGDKVSVGQTIICIEAMKMENNINSDLDGVVTKIHVQKGDVVLEGDLLIEVG